MTDIRDLLSKAIGDDEPPMGIDRDEVFRAGRQRVRRRRALAAGGVVAAVVVAVVGAAVLTDFVETPREEAPVAEAPPAPPGPDLPLPPSTKPGAPRAMTEQHANVLTQKLYSSGLVGIDSAQPWPGHGPKARFRVADGEYLYEADISGAGRKGQLQVTVGVAPPNRPASCEKLGERYDSCSVTTEYGQPVVQATWKGADGERRNLAVVVLSDGTKVAAVATNLLRRDEEQGKKPHGEATVLDVEELTKLITKSGFSV